MFGVLILILASSFLAFHPFKFNKILYLITLPFKIASLNQSLIFRFTYSKTLDQFDNTALGLPFPVELKNVVAFFIQFKRPQCGSWGVMIRIFYRLICNFQHMSTYFHILHFIDLVSLFYNLPFHESRTKKKKKKRCQFLYLLLLINIATPKHFSYFYCPS